METTDPVLRLDGLSKRYGDAPVFEGVSLDLRPGEFVAIVGDSGVGKSTLLNCMAGLDQWDAGQVRLCGQSLDGLDDDARALLRRQTSHASHGCVAVSTTAAMPISVYIAAWNGSPVL